MLWQASTDGALHPHAIAARPVMQNNIITSPSLQLSSGAEVAIAPVSLAALSRVETPNTQAEMPSAIIETSDSGASEATHAVGTAELLLLQSTPSCYASPLIASTPSGEAEPNKHAHPHALLLPPHVGGSLSVDRPCCRLPFSRLLCCMATPSDLFASF